METVYRLKVSELNMNFLKTIKSLFEKDKEIEIKVTPSADFGLNKKETCEEYFNRLRKALKNVETGKNVVTFNEDELEEFSNNLIEKK